VLGTAASTSPALDIVVHHGAELSRRLPQLEAYFHSRSSRPLSRHPLWLLVLTEALGHDAYCMEAQKGAETRGFLPLAYVRSLLFGRFLVSLPYLNYGGVFADSEYTARPLIQRAVELADQLDVRYLELRCERTTVHPELSERPGYKAHLRLELPRTPGNLWDRISAKVRNQVRKGQKNGVSITWGKEEMLDAFYAVFSHNMRDLGTPVYGRSLFAAALRHFPDRAEICVAQADGTPVAAALLLHGWGVTEVPSASSLRTFNHTNANMLMYWSLLERAVERGQAEFDFGRSSPESNTFHFKRQWGAVPFPAEWQFYVRSGTADDLRADNPSYRRMVSLWKRLPVWLSRLLGPRIVRGIP
jgi:FemAB-related protein (PEP-CTERM system-associated)